MQIKNSFDNETLKKIGKGALIAMTAGLALGFFDYLGTVDFTNPTLTYLVATLTPVAVNAIKEWRAGEQR